MQTCFILKGVELPRDSKIPNRFMVDLRQALGHMRKLPSRSVSQAQQQTRALKTIAQTEVSTANRNQVGIPDPNRPHRDAKANTVSAIESCYDSMNDGANALQLNKGHYSAMKIRDEYAFDPTANYPYLHEQSPRAASLIPRKRTSSFDVADSVIGKSSDMRAVSPAESAQVIVGAQQTSNVNNEFVAWRALGIRLREAEDLTRAQVKNIVEAKRIRDESSRVWVNEIESDLRAEFDEGEEQLRAQLRELEGQKDDRRKMRKQKITSSIGKLNEDVEKLERERDAGRSTERDLRLHFNDHPLSKEKTSQMIRDL